jgi:hypothetical protein
VKSLFLIHRNGKRKQGQEEDMLLEEMNSPAIKGTSRHVVHGSEWKRSENSVFHVLIVHKRVSRSLITQPSGKV